MGKPLLSRLGAPGSVLTKEKKQKGNGGDEEEGEEGREEGLMGGRFIISVSTMLCAVHNSKML